MIRFKFKYFFLFVRCIQLPVVPNFEHIFKLLRLVWDYSKRMKSIEAGK